MALKHYLSVLALTALLVLAISVDVFAAVSGLPATMLIQLMVILGMVFSLISEAKHPTDEYHLDIMTFSLLELVIAYTSFIEGAYGVSSLIAGVASFTFAVGFVMYSAELYSKKRKRKKKKAQKPQNLKT